MSIILIKSLFFLVLIFLLPAASLSFGKTPPIDSTQTIRQGLQLKLVNGNLLSGKLLSDSADSITLKNSVLGVISIPKDSIESMENPTPDQYFPNPHPTRYFYSPSGINLKQGEGYYQNTWVLMNQFSYGLHKNFSMGMGFVPLFLFNGTPTPVWFTPKFSYSFDSTFHTGAGLLAGTVVGESQNTFGILYASFCGGEADDNFTVNVGWTYANGDWAEQPVYSMGFMKRLSEKNYLLSENFLIPQEDLYILGIGGRRVWKSLSLEYGLLAPFSSRNMGDFFALPWLSVTLPFGNTRPF
jgi:hypothetical protein